MNCYIIFILSGTVFAISGAFICGATVCFSNKCFVWDLLKANFVNVMSQNLVLRAVLFDYAHMLHIQFVFNQITTEIACSSKAMTALFCP